MSIHLQHDQTNQAHEVPDEWFALKNKRHLKSMPLKDPHFRIGQILGDG